MSAPSTPCLLGLTASGKSAVAASLARKTGGEVIACDAFSVYRGMAILAAASVLPPDVPHHLVGILEPSRTWSAAAFVDACDDAVLAIRGRDHVPWIVGGTALYLRSWLKGFGAPIPRDPAFRRSLEARLDAEGPEGLHETLRRLDRERAAALHPNDVRRVVRALEIVRATGRKASDLRSEWAGPDRRPARLYGLRRGREDLDLRIERRTRAMFESGVVLEVEALLGRELSPEAAKVLGLAEIQAHLNGTSSLEETRARIAQRTRRLARKQQTFFNSFENVRWIDASPASSPESLADAILAQETEATSA